MRTYTYGRRLPVLPDTCGEARACRTASRSGPIVTAVTTGHGRASPSSSTSGPYKSLDRSQRIRDEARQGPATGRQRALREEDGGPRLQHAFQEKQERDAVGVLAPSVSESEPSATTPAVALNLQKVRRDKRRIFFGPVAYWTHSM